MRRDCAQLLDQDHKNAGMLNAVCGVSMRYRPKTFIASLLASVLLYYGAAWALLRCCHHDGYASVHDESLSDSDVHQRQGYYFSSNHASTYIDCIEEPIHTEILASSTAPSPLHRAANFTKEFSDPIAFALTHANAYRVGQVWARGSPPALYANTSIYLSLSILRI